MKKAIENITCKDWLVWLKTVNKYKNEFTKEDYVALRNAIINFPEVAEMFFYKTLTPMCKGFSHKILETYNLHIDDRDIATDIYLAMYDYGTWARMIAFRGDCSLFTWIATCASQYIYTDLKNNNYIENSHKLTPKNTSLKLKSMRFKEEIEMVVDLVDTPELNLFLKLKFVERKSKDEIKNYMNYNETIYVKTENAAETLLKDNLIKIGHIFIEREDGSVVNLVSESLSDVSRALNIIRSDDNINQIEGISDAKEYSYIHEVLEQYYPGLPVKEQWLLFVMDKAAELNWTNEDYNVFKERFYNHTDPVFLSKQLGRARSWVDNKYSRLNKSLVLHIKTWWMKNAI